MCPACMATVALLERWPDPARREETSSEDRRVMKGNPLSIWRPAERL